ncbi:MAG TPA: hypothetical protein PK467_04980, partial [Candidatus Wallbacteria bacterium]|nr:hypothetical protein [Candidatus Wallbacteria bacterium]
MSGAINTIYDYIDSLSVMVLSTAGFNEAECEAAKDTPAGGGLSFPAGARPPALRSTPVFFARKNNSFYFISVAKTVHARNISQNPYISAALTKNYRNYRDIKGVQLFGHCSEIEGLTGIARAAMVY